MQMVSYNKVGTQNPASYVGKGLQRQKQTKTPRGIRTINEILVEGSIELYLLSPGHAKFISTPQL